MDKLEIIKEVEKRLKDIFGKEGTGHGWWHSVRTRNMAKKIYEKEGGDFFIIELASLLHDLDDCKFSDLEASTRAKEMLKELGVENNIIEHISNIIDNVSYKGAGVKDKMETIEGKIVQDADRIDAIGAIGIARTFAYGGLRQREIYNPNIKPELHATEKEYRDRQQQKSIGGNNGTSFNHFYEKILLLKDRLNTKTARQIAEERHKFVEAYLKQFLAEWEGKL